MIPRVLLTAFDHYHAPRGLRLDAVVVGGAALSLLGVISRPTKDCDVLYPALSPAIAEAARAFAAEVRAAGEVLTDNWLNNGPASLVPQLRAGWQDRLQPLLSAAALGLRTLGREDLLCSKLFALCDRGLDRDDCLALAPTRDELLSILPWLEQQDANPDWPAHARATLDDLARSLGHGL
jgi:hypothetical protein